MLLSCRTVPDEDVTGQNIELFGKYIFVAVSVCGHICSLYIFVDAQFGFLEVQNNKKYVFYTFLNHSKTNKLLNTLLY